MQNKIWKFCLQFFAEGGEGAEASSGVTAADAGQQTGVITADAGQTQAKTLEELGVPKDKAERYRAKKGIKAEPPKAEEQPKEEPVQDAAANDTAKSEQSIEDLMNRQDIKQKMQEIVSHRVKKMQQTVDSAAPILELLAKKYGVDAQDIGKLDINALADKVRDDSYFYEETADELGTDVETAKANVQRELSQNARERDISRREEELKGSIEQMAINRHLEKLDREAAELKKQFPDFDLKKELANPDFYRLTAPGVGLSVETAYYAVHRREIEEAKAAQTARNVARAISNSVASGGQIPKENTGGSKASGVVADKLYSQMSKEERAAYKANLQRNAHRR